VLGPLAGELRERLQAAPDWPARFAALDRVLLRRAGQPRGVHPAVAQAWRLAVASRGGATVSGLASTAGWSTRHLRSQFLRETGLTPRAAIRVSRFDHARRLLQRRAAAGQPPALADLAADCGYYDQAHLAREFRDLAGQPPSAWLAEEFPFVQALAGSAGQDHRHDS
jgi:AraC-like DNA-binding protein